MEGPKNIHKHLFRAAPPQEFVEEILRWCGIEGGLSDRRFISKVSLQQGVRTQEHWLPFLEPYYLPCKAERFFGSRAAPFTPARMVTILRHILRQHNHDLVAEEVTDHGVKQTLYQVRPILPVVPTHPPEMEVVFS